MTKCQGSLTFYGALSCYMCHSVLAAFHIMQYMRRNNTPGILVSPGKSTPHHLRSLIKSVLQVGATKQMNFAYLVLLSGPLFQAFEVTDNKYIDNWQKGLVICLQGGLLRSFVPGTIYASSKTSLRERTHYFVITSILI